MLIPNKTVEAIYKSYEDRQEGPRPHLGASEIGKACDRALWYGFRHATYPKFEGRLLRLFERGQREEEVFVKNLRDIGVTVWELDPTTGKQINFKLFGGHFSGSCDGIGKGFIEAPVTPHVLEFKTSSDKLFKKLQSEGVEKAKPEHFAQVQVYMKMFDLDRAYYFAVNKDNDEIYGERIHYCPVTAKRLVERAQRIIFAQEPPEKLSQDPAFWQCKWCSHWEVCHNQKLPEVNCRTCAHGEPNSEGGWRCEDGQAMKPDCDSHIYRPVFFLPHVPVNYQDQTMTLDDGTKVGKNGLKSKNIRAVWNTSLAQDETVKALETEMGATIQKAWKK